MRLCYCADDVLLHLMVTAVITASNRQLLAGLGASTLRAAYNLKGGFQPHLTGSPPSNEFYPRATGAPPVPHLSLA